MEGLIFSVEVVCVCLCVCLCDTHDKVQNIHKLPQERHPGTLSHCILQLQHPSHPVRCEGLLQGKLSGTVSCGVCTVCTVTMSVGCECWK